MVRILVNDGIHPDGKLLLEEAGYEVVTDKVAQEDLPKELPNFDAIIVRSATKVRKELIDLCPNLKIIARGGVGLDNIDVTYAREKGITVMNTPAASSKSVAELVFGHMFSLARSLHLSNREMPVRGGTEFKKLKKSYSKGIQLHGKSLGIIGLGRIGREVARMGLGLGMKILPVDLYIDEITVDVALYSSEEVGLSVKLTTCSLDEMLAQADFITLHVPFSGGKPILGAEEMAKMKDGAYIVNAARGGTVDEQALLAALESGKLAGAALDVFDLEPSPQEEILNNPKISLTPHTGASTVEAQRNIGLELADKIIAFYGDDK
ncbi:MAG: D-2-hydroxyacid dehydrogenase [Bacteroidota bacterium]